MLAFFIPCAGGLLVANIQACRCCGYACPTSYASLYIGHNAGGVEGKGVVLYGLVDKQAFQDVERGLVDGADFDHDRVFKRKQLKGPVLVKGRQGIQEMEVGGW